MKNLKTFDELLNESKEYQEDESIEFLKKKLKNKIKFSPEEMKHIDNLMLMYKKGSKSSKNKI